VQIRPATEADVEPLVDGLWTPFMRELLADGPDELAEGFREDALAHRREQLEREDRIDRVAEAGGTLLGYVSAEIQEPPPVVDRGDTLHINEVYVRPEHRREGVGAALLAEAEEWGDRQGCTHVTLSVNRPNDSAQALYQERGFEVVRHRMRKPLE